MSYAEASLIWEGALNETRVFTNEVALDQWASEAMGEAQAKGEYAAVFVVWHEHAQGIDCGCVQFLTDHHPRYSYDPSAHAESLGE